MSNGPMEGISPFVLRALACDMEEMQSPQAWADRCRAAAAEIEKLRAGQDKARGYLSRCLKVLHPHIELLPNLLGVCTQIDHLLVGQAAARDALRAENARLRQALKNLLPQAVNDRYLTQSAEVEEARAARGEKE